MTPTPGRRGGRTQEDGMNAPEWKNMADWSDLPDVYVTKAECQQGMFWRIEACSVPMAIGPEVRLIRADRVDAPVKAAVEAERERLVQSLIGIRRASAHRMNGPRGDDHSYYFHTADAAIAAIRAEMTAPIARDEVLKLLDDADRIAVTDLYPARCRKVIVDLAAALRKSISELDESREYGLALEAELKARAEQTSAFVAMSASMDADFEAAVRPEDTP